MFLAAGRHIEVFRQKAEAAGKPLPITINGSRSGHLYWRLLQALPRRSAITAGRRRRAASTSGGAGSGRRVPEKAIARAEIVIEGELLPGVRVREDQHTNSGHAMPEFPATAAALIRRCR
nr:UbiD family decarboxylase [Klebsiella pneumoniae subsp. pneumoniae]